jgi:hypothetical protein
MIYLVAAAAGVVSAILKHIVAWARQTLGSNCALTRVSREVLGERHSIQFCWESPIVVGTSR